MVVELATMLKPEKTDHPMGTLLKTEQVALEMEQVVVNLIRNGIESAPRCRREGPSFGGGGRGESRNDQNPELQDDRQGSR